MRNTEQCEAISSVLVTSDYSVHVSAQWLESDVLNDTRQHFLFFELQPDDVGSFRMNDERKKEVGNLKKNWSDLLKWHCTVKMGGGGGVVLIT